MRATIGRIVLYTKDPDAMVAFYERHFGFVAHQEEGDRIVELVAPDGGASLMLHPAAKGMRQGQSIVKLVFDVPDVEAFCDAARRNGLEFGPIHKADGYTFANTRDPSQNPVSVSSRAFRERERQDQE